MIRHDSDIRHGLAHIEIGAPVVQATIGEQRFSAHALSRFFEQLRSGHKEALVDFSSAFEGVIGHKEHSQLDEFGMFGRFAGRLALTESGLAIIEQQLHGESPANLQGSLRGSLTEAVGVLRSS